MADVVEAIVGAAYISSQRSLDVGISAMKRLQIPVLNLTSWSDLGKQSAQPSGSGKKILGYAFRDEQNLGDCFVSALCSMQTKNTSISCELIQRTLIQSSATARLG